MRAFIIGNGPSLNKTPLDLLAGETTFAVNRIHLIYPRTKWRPTHWVLADRSKSSAYVDDILVHMRLGEKCWVRQDFYDDIRTRVGSDVDGIHLYANCPHVDADHNPSMSWHGDTFCCFGGSVPVAIQLAVKMGCDELYVLGCDLGYRGNEVNHFDRGYVDVDSRKVPQAILANKTLKLAHELAYRECSARGIRIANAGLGGDLNVYPRVKLEEILG